MTVVGGFTYTKINEVKGSVRFCSPVIKGLVFTGALYRTWSFFSDNEQFSIVDGKTSHQNPRWLDLPLKLSYKDLGATLHCILFYTTDTSRTMGLVMQMNQQLGSCLLEHWHGTHTTSGLAQCGTEKVLRQYHQITCWMGPINFPEWAFSKI